MKLVVAFCIFVLGDMGKTLRLPSTKDMLEKLEKRIDTRISNLEEQIKVENKQLRNDVFLIYENLIHFEDKIKLLLKNEKETNTENVDKIEDKSQDKPGQRDDQLERLETRMNGIEDDLKREGEVKQALADAVKTITTAVSLISDDIGEIRDGQADLKKNLKSVKEENRDLRNGLRILEEMYNESRNSIREINSALFSVENTCNVIEKTLNNKSMEIADLRDMCFDQDFKKENNLAIEMDKTASLVKDLIAQNSRSFKELKDTISQSQGQCNVNETGNFTPENDLTVDIGTTAPTTKNNVSPKPIVHSSCSDGITRSGVYNIKLPGTPVFQAYCDMDTDGGRWLVFQRRKDGSVDFYRNWNEYKQGFGNVSGEFWLGNDLIHKITSVVPQELRIDLWDWDGSTAYAIYSPFIVDSETNKYRCHLGTFSGTAGDSFILSKSKILNFSTLDRDNDSSNFRSCAELYEGAWWYSNCGYPNLNGHYYPQAQFSHSEAKTNLAGVSWYMWKKKTYYSLKGSEMKLRPK